MGTDENRISIGEIVAPFGRKGEVKVRSETDFPEHFQELEEVYVGETEDKSRVMTIENAWFHKRAVILKFTGVDDISTAETLRNHKIFIPESEMMPLESDEYYVHDVMGIDVETTDGESLGKVKEVLRSPAHDVYVTDRAMIPAVKEFVVSIDIDERRMVVRPIEGLIQG